MQGSEESFADKVLYEGESLDNSTRRISNFSVEASSIYALPYECGSSVYIKKLKDVAMANLVRFFRYAAGLCDKDFYTLKNLFTSTGLISEARLFALLPLAKPHADRYFTDIQNLLGISLIDSGEIDGIALPNLRLSALVLLAHPRAKSVINKLAKLASGETIEINQLVSSDGVYFFRSSDTQFWGFSGIGTIFINLSALEAATQFRTSMVEDDWDQECFRRATILMVAVIGFHVAAHMAIRKATNNVNESNFQFYSTRYNHYKSNDVGVLAQLLLFDQMLNWAHVSSSKQNIHVLFQYFHNPPSDHSVIPHELPGFEPSKLFVAPYFPEIYYGIYKMPRSHPRK